MNPEDALLTTREVAQRLRLNPATVRRWLLTGKLKGTWMGSDKAGWRVPAVEVQRFLGKEEAPPLLPYEPR